MKRDNLSRTPGQPVRDNGTGQQGVSIDTPVLSQRPSPDEDQKTDAELIPLAAGGDEDAFLRLWARYHPLALNVARQIAQNQADAEDVAQLVFQWLLEGRWRLDPATITDNGNIYGFVKRLTVFAAWRFQRPVEETDVDELGVIVKLARSKWPTPEQQLLARELRQQILKAIAELYPPYLRRTARLRYFEELSGPDIARRLGVGASTIPGYLHQIRQRLRPALSVLVTLPEPTGRARGGHLRYANAE